MEGCRLSLSTTRELIALKERGSQAIPAVFCNWHGSVIRTFDSYEKNVTRRYGKRQCDQAMQDCLFPKMGLALHYAYLFSIRPCPNFTFYKVGVSANVCRRFEAFRCSFPSVFHAEAVRVAVLDHEIAAEKLERDVLLACHHVWVGGEWLREVRAVESQEG